jgi:hypothetical protein
MIKHKFCKEAITHIEGYLEYAESDEKWVLHHRLETHRWSKKEQKWVLREKSVPMQVLVDLGLYYGRPASELIYMTASEHKKLHMSIKHYSTKGIHSGKHPWNYGLKGAQSHTEDTKKRISDKMKGGNSTSWKKGNEPWNKGTDMSGMKGKHHSEVSRKKLSESSKLAWLKKDRTPDIWINNGVINTRIKITESIPDGFVRGRMKKNGR